MSSKYLLLDLEVLITNSITPSNYLDLHAEQDSYLLTKDQKFYSILELEFKDSHLSTLISFHPK